MTTHPTPADLAIAAIEAGLIASGAIQPDACMVRRTFSGRWYFTTMRDGVSTSNWSSRRQAIQAARSAGHVIIVAE